MKHILQDGCLVLGILCFLYYAAIVLYAGMSADFAWIWIAGGGFLMAVYVGMRYLGGHPDSPVRFFLWAAALLATVGLLLCVCIGAQICGGMLSKPAQDLDYVIVLGAQVRGNTPSRALLKRLDCAADYARENPDTLFFLSGGKGSGEDISEAECMYEYLVAAGVEEERLIQEDRSTSTQENLQFCRELRDIRSSRVGILSNDFHVYRAGRMAKKQGYRDISLIPAPSDPGMQPHYVIREICALLVAKLTGQI